MKSYFQIRKMGGESMNIYDIAREAGVSISTVSRVINNKSRVSQSASCNGRK